MDNIDNKETVPSKPKRKARTKSKEKHQETVVKTGVLQDDASQSKKTKAKSKKKTDIAKTKSSDKPKPKARAKSKKKTPEDYIDSTVTTVTEDEMLALQAVEEYYQPKKEKSFKKLFKNPFKENPFKNLSPKTLPLKILIQILKTLFIRIPIALLIIIILSLVIAKAFLSPQRTESLIVNVFNSMSTGEIKLDVKEFDPFYGFVIEDIEIINGEQFENSKLVEIEKLVVKYNIFRILSASVRIPEIGIYKPRIYLEEKDGIWSAEAIMKPSEAVEIIEEEPEIEEVVKEVKPPSDLTEIRLPIHADLLFKFVLDDMCVYAKSPDFNAKMEGLTFMADVKIPPFKRVPLSIKALSLIEIMEFQLNPAETLDISFISKDAEMTKPLTLNWNLNFVNRDDSKVFDSKFNFDTNNAPVRFQRSRLDPLSFAINYDLFYDPFADHLKLNSLRVSFKNKNWIYLTGDVTELLADQNIDIKMIESNINLNDLYPYYVRLTGDRSMRFSGNLGLFPLTVKGNLLALDVNGVFGINALRFSMPDVWFSLPRGAFNFNVSMHGEKMDTDIITSLSMPNFQYALNNERSGANGLSLNARITAREEFTKIAVNDFNFRFFYPPSGNNAVSFSMGANVDMASDINGTVDIRRFVFRKGPLLPMLPASIRTAMADIPIEKPITMNMNTRFGLTDRKQNVDLRLNIAVPDFELNDLVFRVNAENYPQTREPL